MQLLYVVLVLMIVLAAAWLIKARLPIGEGARTGGSLQVVVNVVLGLLVVGILLWLINSYVPMAGSIKAILNIVVVVATCVGVLQAVGLWSQIVGAWSKLTYRLYH
jgi:predicted membrane protein